MIVMTLGDTDEFERTFDHAQRRVAITIHEAIGKLAVIGADTHSAAELFAAKYYRGKGFV